MEQKEMHFPTLQQIICDYSMPELRKLAKHLKISGYSHLRKPDLTAAVSQGILSSKLMEPMVIVQDDRTYALFLRAVESGMPVKGVAKSDTFFPDVFSYLFFPSLDDGRCYVPEDVRGACIRMLEDGLTEKRKRNWLMHRYALAAVNLYGLIPAAELIDIFNKQNAKKTDQEEMVRALSRFEVCGLGYHIWNWHIVDDGFAYNNFEDAKDLIRLCENKPRYVPGKKDFLRYSDIEYYEKTVYTQKMAQFLQEEFQVSARTASDMVCEIHQACVIEAELSTYLKFLADFNIIMTGDQTSRFFALVMDIHNNARLWSNKGYTPRELAVMCDRLGGR